MPAGLPMFSLVAEAACKCDGVVGALLEVGERAFWPSKKSQSKMADLRRQANGQVNGQLLVS